MHKPKSKNCIISFVMSQAVEVLSKRLCKKFLSILSISADIPSLLVSFPFIQDFTFLSRSFKTEELEYRGVAKRLWIKQIYVHFSVIFRIFNASAQAHLPQLTPTHTPTSATWTSEDPVAMEIPWSWEREERAKEKENRADSRKY